MFSEPRPLPPVDSAARRWVVPAVLLALCAAVLVASFLKRDLTRNDFERLDDLRLLTLFFGLFAGLCGAYCAAYVGWPAVSPTTVAVTTVGSALLLLSSFPVGSKDVFAYSFFGKIWGGYHANPYLRSIADFPADPWQPFVQARWRSTPTVYGPLFLWQARLVYYLTGEHLWAALWLHKAFALVFLLGGLWVGRAILREHTSDAAGSASWAFVLLAWNPLLLFESGSGGHNDIAMVLLLFGALLCWHRRRFDLALGLLALSIWYKWYNIIFAPPLLIDTLKRSGVRDLAGQGMRLMGSSAAIGLVLLAPLPGSLQTIGSQLLHPKVMQGIYPNELSPPLAILFWTLQVGGALDTEWGIHVFDILRFSIFGVAAGIVLLRQWLSVSSFSMVTETCFLMSCAFFLTLPTMLMPWHLVTAVACGILCRREPFVLAAVVLTILGMLSYFLTFAVAALMLGAVSAAVWLLRQLRRATVRRSDLHANEG